MENIIYKPDIYEGKDPYFFASFHQDDRARVLGILEKLDMRGFRFWLDDGISPGMETDEIIAEHIENCDLFIAFISGNYLNFLDKVDELNYSRDVNKEYLLIYLEDVELPHGLDMRFMRSRNIKAFSLSDDDVYSQLLVIDGANRFYGITDEKLRSSAEKTFARLEKLYPEHKVFAIDAVSKQTSKELSELYVKAGYQNVERLMLDYGFIQISSAEARNLRSSVLYQPGYEPDVIKPRIVNIINTLSADFPTKNITGILSKTHKSLYKSLLGISVWMGYESIGDMLSAYGFTMTESDAGRKETDFRNLIDQLKARYENTDKPSTVSELLIQNSDLKGNIKTLINRSHEVFGMTLLQYLKKINLIVPNTRVEKTTQQAVNRLEIIENIRSLYDNVASEYGTFEEAESILDRIVIKRNSKGEVRIVSCSSCDETMKIPYGIDVIDKEAFSGLGDLTTLILPPTVKEIREAAFFECDRLENIVFSEGLERIADNAFTGCTSLQKITLPKSLNFIGSESFSGCEELAEVEFGNLRTNIQETAFEDCIYELENLQDEGASPAEYFELKVDKKNNAKITAYTGDEEIVVIPGSIGGHPIVSIEKGSFKGNEYVKEIYVSDQISAINGDVFKDCKNLKKIHISESVTTLTATAFSGCRNLSEVNIPDGMQEVQRGLFKDSPLTSLYIGKGTERISPDAFYKGEADFATGAYLKKQSLENLIIDNGNQNFRAEGTMLLSADGKVLIAELGDPVKAVVPEGVEEISNQAFDRLSSLCEIILPSTLKKIGEKAFAGTNLTKVELPASLEFIGTQAFSFCRALTELDINEGLTVIGQQAFEGCPIKEVYIPASVEKIGNDSFFAISTYQGQTPQKFRIDTANKNLIADGTALYEKGENSIRLIKAYHPDLRLKPTDTDREPIEYSIMEGTTEISAQAFAHCNNLEAVHIPEGVLSVGDMAFWNCSKLTEIHIPQSCSDVSPKAFFGININIIR